MDGREPRRRNMEKAKKRYEIRFNIEYVFEVHAYSEDAALKQAHDVDLSQWDQSTSPVYVERLFGDNEFVECKFCRERVPLETARKHGDKFVGGECCWDERLLTTG